MKILHVTDRYREFGGAERYLLDVCAGLEGQGHDIAILTAPHPDNVSVQGRREYSVRPARHLWPQWRAIEAVLEREAPDVLHLHNTHAFLHPADLARIARTFPTVKHVHDVRLICPTGLKVMPLKNRACHLPLGFRCLVAGGCLPFHRLVLAARDLRASRDSSRFVAGCGYLGDELERNGIPRDRIRVLPYFTDKAPEGPAPETDSATLICVGRYARLKGIPQLLDALRLLKDTEWNVVLIIGDDGVLAKMQALARRLGVESRIRFLGQVRSRDMDALFQQCRLAVMPSMIPETFGLVGVEAMAFGRPVVAFDAGAIREWLVDGETGFLVPRGDVQGLANGIARLLEDRTLARKMGQAGRARVEARYRRATHLEGLMAVYREAVEHHLQSRKHP